MSCYVESYHNSNANPNVNPKTTVRHLGMNETVMTHHVKHIFMLADQTINRICMQCNILLNQDKSIP